MDFIGNILSSNPESQSPLLWPYPQVTSKFTNVLSEQQQQNWDYLIENKNETFNFPKHTKRHAGNQPFNKIFVSLHDNTQGGNCKQIIIIWTPVKQTSEPYN